MEKGTIVGRNIGIDNLYENKNYCKNNMNDGFEMDFETAYRETYDRLRVGDNVQILTDVRFQRGIVIDKHFFRIDEQGSYNQVFMDVLLDNGDVIKMFRCYSLFYPRFDWL